MKFLIPVGNLTKEEAEKHIKELMKMYSDYTWWLRKDRKKKLQRIYRNE